MLGFMERVGDDAGVREVPAPPSKAFIKHFHR